MSMLICSVCKTDFERKKKGRLPKFPLCPAHSGTAPAPEGEKPVIHGWNTAPITEPCPMCGYAYADGSYCPPAYGGCGWTLPINRLPYGTAHSRRW